MTIKVFLGGTCNGSKWRDEAQNLLRNKGIDFFNPVVDNWDKSQQFEEEYQKNKVCNYNVYCITPKMTGVFSIAELVDDSNKHPVKTIFVMLSIDDGKEFDKHQKKSLNAVMKMVKDNGVAVYTSLDDMVKRVSGE